MKNIVVSGGWGYGNLGDDAILVATCRLVAEVYPNALITVLTYCLDPQVQQLLPDVRFLESFHSKNDENVSELLYRPVAFKLGIFRKIRAKVRHLGHQRETDIDRLIEKFDGGEADALIRTADLFILGGGGYINQDWLTSVAAHLHELRLARESGVPYILLGPSLGAFTKAAVREQLYECLRNARAVCVRDEFSEADLKKGGIDCVIVPDVALTDFDRADVVKQGGQVAMIVNKTDEHFFDVLASALVDVKGAGHIKGITLLASRLWDGDMRAILDFYACARAHGCPIRIVIPSGLEDLEAEIRKCDIMISENLHGLILAVRNRKSVVAINDYCPGSPNDRKFVAFMSQISSSSSMINGKIGRGDLSSLLLEKFKKIDSDARTLEAFCDSARGRALEFLRTFSS